MLSRRATTLCVVILENMKLSNSVKNAGERKGPVNCLQSHPSQALPCGVYHLACTCFDWTLSLWLYFPLLFEEAKSCLFCLFSKKKVKLEKIIFSIT